MSIIFKFIIRSIKEKKFRSFLIIFSIMISTALFLSSRALLDNMLNEALDNMKSYYGSTDIIIQADENSKSQFFYSESAGKLKDSFEYIIGAVRGVAAYKNEKNERFRMYLQGVDLKEQQIMNPVKMVEEKNLYPFNGKKVVVSSKTAEKYGLNVGNTIELEINGMKNRFFVSGIAKPEGYFFENGETDNVIVPRDMLGTFYNAGKRVSIIYLKTRDSSQKDELIKELSQSYKDQVVKEPFTVSEVKQQIQGISTSFTLIVVILFCISLFIIYSSFKVISMERIQIIGTFRSIGATKKKTNLILLAESIFYGLIGGILGCLLGIGLLYILLVIMLPGTNIAVPFTPVQLISSFIMAVVLSFISTIIPIISVSRIPLKNIILNIMYKKNENKIWKLALGVLFLAVVLIAPGMSSKSMALIVDSICAVLTVAMIILLVPYVTLLFVKLFEFLYTYIFGNIGILAAKNLKDNKNILTNISLLAIGISGILSINTVSSDILSGTVDHYKTRHFDIVLADKNADRNFAQMVSKTDGVKGIYCIYEAHNIGVEGRNYRLAAVQGVDRSKFLDYWDMDIEGNRQSLINKLDEGRYVLVTNLVKDSLDVKIGDEITLKMKSGSRSYKIIGFYNTLIFSGNCVMISERNLKSDIQAQNYYRIYVKTSKDPVEVQKTLKKEFAQRETDMYLTKDAQKSAIDGNSRLFSILNVFSIITLLIGILGIFNNLFISFLERKRIFAMLKSIGMSKTQIIKMVFIESLSGGLIGGIMGCVSGIVMINEIPYLMKAIGQPIGVSVNTGFLIIYMAVGALITLIASISPALKSSRLNVIESIKYE